MAFVFKGERFNPIKVQDGDFYMDLKKYDQKKNFIPFNSSSIKLKKDKVEILSEKEKYKKEYYRLLDKKKKMIYNSIKNIGKANKSNFKYQKRFERNREFMDPGLYNFNNVKNEKKKNNNLNNKIILKSTQYKKKNLDNPPTIPTIYQKKLKKKRKTKSLANLPINQNRSYLVHNKNVGPGQYEINDSELIKKREKNIINWKNSSKRTISLKLLKPFQKEAPLQYLNTIIEKPNKYKQSSVFKSNVFRKTFHKKDKDNKTGPGSYFNPKKQSSFKIQKKEEKFQFFSTSKPRFFQGKNIGCSDPGNYEVQSSFKDNLYNTNYGQFAFGVSSSRFIKRKQSVPGPDMYNWKKNFIKKTFNKRDYFISKQKRFKKKKIEEPDYSKMKEEKKIYKIPKQREKIKNSSLRKEKNYKKKIIHPEPGQYDISLNNISYQKKFKNIRELNKKEIEKLGFMSKENRFVNKKTNNRKDINNIQDQYHYNILKDPFQENIVPFCSSENRFVNKKKTKKPEYYSRRKPWNTKSFNITYN